jgi:hypothetical protein
MTDTVADMAALPIDQILRLYPSLAQVQPALDQLGQSLALYQVPADTVLFSENAACQGFPLVLQAAKSRSRAIPVMAARWSCTGWCQASCAWSPARRCFARNLFPPLV